MTFFCFLIFLTWSYWVRMCPIENFGENQFHGTIFKSCAIIEIKFVLQACYLDMSNER